jgi:DNA polymerase-3 subunit delta
MAFLSDTELIKNVRQNKIEPVYFLYGKELVLLEKSVDILVKKIVSGTMKSFNLQKFDSDKLTIEEIQNAAEALPMMAEKKCVLVNNLNVEKISASQNQALKSLLADIPSSTVLIFSITAFDVNLKKMPKFKSFADLISKHGTVTEFGLKDKRDLIKVLCERAEKQGCSLSSSVAGKIIDRCGQSLHVLYNELQKLCDYAGEGEITLGMVAQGTTESVESSAFDLSKAILRGDYDRSLHLLNELFYQRIEPVVILGALNLSFIDLYRAKCATMSGKKVQDILNDFGYKKNVEFRVKNAVNDASKHSLSHLRTCINSLMDADQKLKSTGLDGKILLEQLVCKMLTAE